MLNELNSTVVSLQKSVAHFLSTQQDVWLKQIEKDIMKLNEDLFHINIPEANKLFLATNQLIFELQKLAPHQFETGVYLDFLKVTLTLANDLTNFSKILASEIANTAITSQGHEIGKQNKNENQFKVYYFSDSNNSDFKTKIQSLDLRFFEFSDLERLCKSIIQENPDLVLIENDTNNSAIETIIEMNQSDILSNSDFFLGVVAAPETDIQTRMKFNQLNIDQLFYYCSKREEISIAINLLKKSQEFSPYKALILDENMFFTSFYSRLLEKNNIATDIANDPKVLLQKIYHFKPEVILIDVQMGEISGIDIAKVIKQTTRNSMIPIILLSSSDKPNTYLIEQKISNVSFCSQKLYQWHPFLIAIEIYCNPLVPVFS